MNTAENRIANPERGVLPEFRTYFWKEWREQRALLGALAGALLIATFVIGALLDREALESTFIYEGILVLSVGTALFTVGSDLFARERQHGRLQFLERLPGGLSAAFHGKLALFLLVLVAALVYGMLLGALCGLTLTGEVPAVRLNPAHGHIAVLLVPAALWVFAVSSWVPASVMAVPSSALLATLYLLPAWLLLRAAEIPPPRAGTFWALNVALTVGVLTCARLSFVHATSRSRPRRLAVCSGLVTGLIAFLPCTAWAGWHYAAWLDWPYLIQHVLIGREGRFAFINLVRTPEGLGRRPSSSTLVLNLHEPDWRFEGTDGMSCFVDVGTSHLTPSGVSSLRVALYDEVTGSVGLVYDPATGEPTASTIDRIDPTPAYKAADFGLDRFPGPPFFLWAGLGQRALCKNSDGNTSVYLRAPGRSKSLSLEYLRGHWDVRALTEGILIANQGAWSWLKPETGELSAFEHLAEGEKIGATLTNGKLLVHGDGSLAILEPNTGHRDPVEIRTSQNWRGTIQDIHAGQRPSPGRAPVAADREVVVLVDFLKHGSHKWALALLDVPNGLLQLSPCDPGAHGPSSIYWSEGPRVIFVEEQQRLVHYDLKTDQRRVLLDVDDLTP